ncbi:MAG: hypothetical protein DI617_04410 [Streptococcus pyogenes]|nr:MAG: hypothetical protein DI617_04410 [Streptococcus pyogenes]
MSEFNKRLLIKLKPVKDISQKKQEKGYRDCLTMTYWIKTSKRPSFVYPLLGLVFLYKEEELKESLNEGAN